MAGTPSPAFEQFLYHWFVNSWDLTRHEVDLSFIDELSPDELDRARELLRMNLHLKQNHIIEGVAILRDLKAVPLLRSLLEAESSSSRRLTIAGSLSKLTDNHALSEAISGMVNSGTPSLKSAHFHQILWLDDERAINALFDLCVDSDNFVRFLAVKTLNALEFDRRFSVPEKELPHGSDYYQGRRHEAEFRQLLVRRLHTQNIERQDG